MVNNNDLKEYMLKEIEIIQDIIKRMASNSFIIKGWAITLVVAALLLKGNEDKAYLASIPLLVFWGLDAYFLQLERRYKELYKWVIRNRERTREHLLDMDTRRFRKEVSCWLRVMISKTLLWFYGSIAILILTYTFILIPKGGG